jgi:hypothetical protein
MGMDATILVANSIFGWNNNFVIYLQKMFYGKQIHKEGDFGHRS